MVIQKLLLKDVSSQVKLLCVFYPKCTTVHSLLVTSFFMPAGIEDVSRIPEHIVFHSGTTQSANGAIVTNGGRVLMPVALASSLPIAVAQATSACDIIKFDGAQYRRDIAHKGISRLGL